MEADFRILFRASFRKDGMDTDNGILARVPGECIADGSKQLPVAGPELQAQPLREVLVRNVRDLGDVLITYRLNTYRHGKSRRWHWAAVRADLPAQG